MVFYFFSRIRLVRLPSSLPTHKPHSLPSNTNTLKNSFECCGDIRCAANWPTRRRSEKLCFIIMIEWATEWVQLWCVILPEKNPEKCRIYYHSIQYYYMPSCEWHRFASWLVIGTTRICCLLCVHAFARKQHAQHTPSDRHIRLSFLKAIAVIHAKYVSDRWWKIYICRWPAKRMTVIVKGKRCAAIE